MQAGEIQPFVEQILLNITAIICDLQPHQVSCYQRIIEEPQAGLGGWPSNMQVFRGVLLRLLP